MKPKERFLIGIAVVGLVVWLILMLMVRIELIKWVLS